MPATKTQPSRVHLHRRVSPTKRRISTSASASASPPPSASVRARAREESLPRDIQLFRNGYAGQPDVLAHRANLDFYSNLAPMRPDGLRYDEFMRKNEGDWEELEYNHSYIQWLFPIPERGVNYLAQPLQAHEAEAMGADPEILQRIVRSYTMMLAFYGIDFNNGHLALSDEYQSRLRNLSANSHNLLRITRILKHISLFPTLQPHAAPLVLFFAALHSDGHINLSPGRMHGQSLERFWAGCFPDGAEMRAVRALVARRGAYGAGEWGVGRWEEWYAVNRGGGEGGGRVRVSGKSVFFLGATGYIGGSVLTALLANPAPPSSITALVRNADKAALLEKLAVPSGTTLRALVGSMEEHDKVVAAAADADVIVNTANADDLDAVKSLFEGMKRRKAKTGHRTLYIHTSGTGVFADNAKGNHPSDLIYTDLNPTPASRHAPALVSVEEIPASAPHREVDIAITAADAEAVCKAYIVVPSTIWGVPKGQVFDKGISNPFSVQMPILARIGLDRARAGMVGKGANIWPHVHIADIAALFSLVYTGAVKSTAGGSNNIGHGKAGYYFGCAGEYTLLSAASAIGTALVERGIATEAQPTTLSEDEMKKYYGGSYYGGSNSRGRADRSKSIGWRPEWTDERDFLADVRREVGAMEEKYGRTYEGAQGRDAY